VPAAHTLEAVEVGPVGPGRRSYRFVGDQTPVTLVENPDTLALEVLVIVVHLGAPGTTIDGARIGIGSPGIANTPAPHVIAQGLGTSENSHPGILVVDFKSRGSGVVDESTPSPDIQRRGSAYPRVGSGFQAALEIVAGKYEFGSPFVLTAPEIAQQAKTGLSVLVQIAVVALHALPPKFGARGGFGAQAPAVVGFSRRPPLETRLHHEFGEGFTGVLESQGVGMKIGVDTGGQIPRPQSAVFILQKNISTLGKTQGGLH